MAIFCVGGPRNMKLYLNHLYLMSNRNDEKVVLRKKHSPSKGILSQPRFKPYHPTKLKVYISPRMETFLALIQKESETS